MQSILILIAHALHATAPGSEMQSLLRHKGLVTLLEFAHRTQQPLPQLDLHAGFNLLLIGAGLYPSNEIQPVQLRTVAYCHHAINLRLARNRKPERSRLGYQALAVIAGRRNTDKCVRRTVDDQARSDNRWVLAKLLLPCAIAHHYDRSCAWLIIGRLQQSSGVSINAESLKGIAG